MGCHKGAKISKFHKAIDLMTQPKMKKPFIKASFGEIFLHWSEVKIFPALFIVC